MFLGMLCHQFSLGLTEEARANFKIMRDVATHTRQPPAQRIDTLNKFVSGINT